VRDWILRSAMMIGYRALGMEHGMHVRKLGERLFVELPTDVVERLGLKDGDDVPVDVSDDARVRVHVDDRRARALAALADLGARATPLPAGYKFDRNKANER
jgi:antitoxin MazE